MPFTEDLSQFFDLDDFAVAAVVKNDSNLTVRTVNVLDNLPTEEVAMFDTDVRTDMHYVLARYSDVSDMRDGWKMVISGVTYRASGAPKRVEDGALALVQLRA